MTRFLPTASQFRARLQQSGWEFAFSYALVLAVALFASRDAAATVLLFALSVTLINLAQVALSAGFPHLGGLLNRPDTAAMPAGRRYINYALEGLHWTLLMIAFSKVYWEPSQQFYLVIWLGAGVFFTLATAFLAERSLRTHA